MKAQILMHKHNYRLSSICIINVRKTKIICQHSQQTILNLKKSIFLLTSC